MSAVVAVVDTETTGTGPNAVPIEAAWAYVDVETAEVVSIHSVLWDADENPAEHINGISHGLLSRHGVFRSPVTLECDAVLAHNAEFDRATGAFETTAPWVCTKTEWNWPRQAGSQKLVDIALAHGVGVASAHRAFADVMTLCLTLQRAHALTPLADMLAFGLLPRSLYAAHFKYGDETSKQAAKDCGFRWDQARRLWLRKLTVDQASLFSASLDIRPVASPTKQRQLGFAGAANTSAG